MSVITLTLSNYIMEAVFWTIERWTREREIMTWRIDGVPLSYVGMFVDITHRKKEREMII